MNVQARKQTVDAMDIFKIPLTVISNLLIRAPPRSRPRTPPGIAITPEDEKVLIFQSF